MIKNVLSFCVLFCFFSCVQQTETKQDDINNNNGNVVVDTAGNAVTVINLKTQLKEYLMAFNTGDADKALYYIYPVVFDYLRGLYPDEKFDIQDIKDSLFIEPMKKMKQLAKEKKMKYEFEIDSLLNGVNYKSNKIYTVVVSINAKWGLRKYSTGEKIIAISDDKGTNWKFFSIDKETVKGILLVKFPQDIVTKIIGKNPIYEQY